MAEDSFDEQAFFAPMPVVLTATRLPQPLADAPGAITVIDRSLIERTGYRDIPRLLRFVPGIHVGQERANASWVSYHGLGQSLPGEVQILIDGAPAHVPVTFGTLAWNGLPVFMSEIERIEVVRGASGNSFGASALLGAVNIITRPSSEAPGSRAQVVLGDRSVRDLEAAWSGGDGPLTLRVTAGEQHDEGFAGLHDHRRTQRLSVRADAQISPEDSFSVRAGSTRELMGRGYPDSPFDNNDERDASESTHMLHLRWSRQTDTDRGWSLSAYHHQLDYRDAWFGGMPPALVNIPLDRDRRDLVNALSLQWHDRFSDRLRAVWGAEGSWTSTRSPFSFNSREAFDEHVYRLFANTEWRALDDTTLNAGVAAQRTEDAGLRWSTRLFASQRLSEADTLRIGVSRAWRNTSVFELHGDTRVINPANGALLARPYMPNPDLRPTRADTFELGYIRQLQWAQGLFELRVFRERLRDLVIREAVTAPAPVPLLASQIPTTRFANHDQEVRVTGLEVQWQARPWSGGELRLAWSVIDRMAGNEQIEAGIPPYTASLVWQQDWPHRWQSLVHLTRVGPVASGDSYLAGQPCTLLNDYTSIDVALTRDLNLGGQAARLTLAALNLGPRHQEIADPAVQQVRGDRPANRVSRQVYLGLDIRF